MVPPDDDDEDDVTDEEEEEETEDEEESEEEEEEDDEDDDDDFEDDQGDWTAADYLEAATNIFGDHAFWGDTAHQRYLDEGFALHEDHDDLVSRVEQHVGEGAADLLAFYTKDDSIVPRGILTSTALALLRVAMPDVDFSRVHVTLPPRDDDGSSRAPQPLPPQLANVNPADSVDLRRFCTPVGDQGDTSRCAAFAWTHALEMTARMAGAEIPRLACSYTMLQFQRRQGDAKNFRYAYSGGDGTSGTWEPGQVLVEHGTCSEQLWRNDEPDPRAQEHELASDAQRYRLRAKVFDVGLEDLKKVLSAGHPVQLSMTTGKGFDEIGRDGVVHVPEEPWGKHGYHAMLCVGYIGNHFIVKNSWGEDWGDSGYCYIPKAVLQFSDPDFTAIVPEGASVATFAQPQQQQQPMPSQPRAGAAMPQMTPYAQPIPYYQQYQQQQQYAQQQQQVQQHAPRFCSNCGKPVTPGGHFCASCGSRVA